MNKNGDKKILVYGGTGYYGRNVVRKLIEKGCSVKVVSRNLHKAKALFGESVEIFQGDVTCRDTIIESLMDVKAIVVCLSAMNNRLIRKMKEIEQDAVLAIMEEAKKAGISRLIYMSGYEMRESYLKELNIPEFGEIKIRIEAEIRRSDFNWTILGDAPAYEIFFAFIRNGRMVVPGGGFNRIPSISGEDVGEITAQAVLREDLNGRRIRLTGPEAMNFPEAAKKISEVCGRNIKHMSIPLGIINLVSLLALPFNPFFRYLYKSLKMLNHFPPDLSAGVPADHAELREIFDYHPIRLEIEAKKRMERKEM